jgi:hypothetical protein
MDSFLVNYVESTVTPVFNVAADVLFVINFH